MAKRDDARRVAETMLCAAGRAITVRVPQASAAPPLEMVLQPCLLKVTGEAAELIVAASAMADVAGLAAELFSISARVVVDDAVWRVVSYATMQCGETVIGWRIRMAR